MNKVKITIWVTEETKSHLRELADASDRSISRMVEEETKRAYKKLVRKNKKQEKQPRLSSNFLEEDDDD